LLVFALIQIEAASEKLAVPTAPSIELKRAHALSKAALQAVRELVCELNNAQHAPAASATPIDLGGELARHAEQVSAMAGRRIDVECTTGVDIPACTANTICMAVRELLINACKHTRDAAIGIHLHPAEHGFSILVHDDGVGFDAHLQYSPPTAEGGYGLQRLSQLLDAIGARFAFDTGPTGTWARIDWCGHADTLLHAWHPEQEGVTA
jgi:signal transduction histidine kinase